MNLYLVRHGIAIERDDPKCPPEPDRYLTPKGVRVTRAVGAALRDFGVELDAIASSPYLRARQTAEILAEELRPARDGLVIIESLVPHGDPARVIAEASSIKGESMMLVGHAPNIDLLLARLVTAGRNPVTAMKRAGVACVTMNDWSPGEGNLVFVAPPRLMRMISDD